MKRVNQFGPMMAAAALLAGCETGQAITEAPSATSNVSETTDSLDHFSFGPFSSSAWISDSFDGTKARQFRGDVLHFEVEQFASDGGLDVGVAPIDAQLTPTAQAKQNLHICSTYETELSGPGRWWAGPKINVNWQGDESAKQNGDDWYENYIVEIASSTPDELHALFTGDYFKAEELPPLELSGATYRNYKIRFHDWWQFWSVRQTYRASGVLPVEPIVDTWIDHGLPADRTFDGIKANIETYGPIEGTGSLSVRLGSSPDALTCGGGDTHVQK
jgi:hypothetical protein